MASRRWRWRRPGSTGSRCGTSWRRPAEFELVLANAQHVKAVPGRKRDVVAVQLEADGRPLTRAALRALDELEGWHLLGIHTKPLSFRPVVPARLRDRVNIRTVRREDVRAELLAEAAVFVPVPGGHTRLRLEAAAAGCAIADQHGSFRNGNGRRFAFS